MGPLGRAIVRYLAVIGIGLFLHTAPARAAQILVNPGFETGALAPWFQDRDLSTAGVDWSATATDAHSGTFSAVNTGNIELRQDFPAIPTSSILEVSFWVKHPDARVTAFAVDLFYTDLIFTQVEVTTTSTDWEFFNVRNFLEPGKALAGFSVFGNTTQDIDLVTFFDDARIITAAVVEPGTSMLLGAGLMGLLAFGWRRRREIQPA